jgi:hypothetical protein
MEMDAVDFSLLFDTGYDHHRVLARDISSGHKAKTHEEEGNDS